MKDCAGSVNHDHIFRTFGANSVRHTRRNYDADVIVAPMVIAADKETHHAPGKTHSHVAQNYLNATLQEKHYVPLLIIVATQRIILRLIDKHTAQPICWDAFFWNAGRMHMETFCRVCKHPRSRPLLRPEANLRENPFVPPHQFAKETAVTLWVNLSRENFHAWDPRVFNLAGARPLFDGRERAVRIYRNTEIGELDAGRFARRVAYDGEFRIRRCPDERDWVRDVIGFAKKAFEDRFNGALP